MACEDGHYRVRKLSFVELVDLGLTSSVVGHWPVQLCPLTCLFHHLSNGVKAHGLGDVICQIALLRIVVYIQKEMAVQLILALGAERQEQVIELDWVAVNNGQQGLRGKFP